MDAPVGPAFFQVINGDLSRRAQGQVAFSEFAGSFTEEKRAVIKMLMQGDPIM